MSSIEWTDATWNPVVGCDRISTGCDHCYAITMARRFNHIHYTGLVADDDWTGIINAAPDHIWDKPLRTRKPTVWFVNSMSDMFHDQVQDEWIVRVFDIMNRSPRHVFQVLTKRPSRMVKKTKELGLRWSDNIWAGTSIESDKYALGRSRELLKVPALVRFVSAEPLLSALPSLPVADLDWLIAGGESGNQKTVRPCDPDWLRDLRDRCAAAVTPFFFKQWGAFGEDGKRRSKGDNGHMLDGREIFEMPASAYDQMPTPDPRWLRHTGGGKARYGEAELTPSERFDASAAAKEFFIVHGRAFDDEGEAVIELLKGDGPSTSYQARENPNIRPNLGPEGPATFLDLYR